MPRKLPHYLRIERRRKCFTQGDIAVLLGVRAVSKVSRYERSRGLPPLETALAYEAILGRPLSELFAGTYEAIRREISRRVDLLTRAPRRKRSTNFSARRKESINNLASR
jgi:transcriptional regulator with XRE-family HTH domain